MSDINCNECLCFNICTSPQKNNIRNCSRYKECIPLPENIKPAKKHEDYREIDYIENLIIATYSDCSHKEDFDKCGTCNLRNIHSCKDRKLAELIYQYLIHQIILMREGTIRYILDEISLVIMEHLGVKNEEELEKLSLIDSTLTYDVVFDAIKQIYKHLHIETTEYSE